MVTVTLHDGTHIDEADSLAQAIAEARQYWMEEPEGPQAFLISEEGCVLAVLMRDQSDPEVCHTMYADGTVVHHRCHYLEDERGWYVGTEVTAIQPEACVCGRTLPVQPCELTAAADVQCACGAYTRLDPA